MRVCVCAALVIFKGSQSECIRAQLCVFSFEFVCLVESG